MTSRFRSLIGLGESGEETIPDSPISALEQRVMDRINLFYLIPRKSFEVPTHDGNEPLSTTFEVREIADLLLEKGREELGDHKLISPWDNFWAVERATAMVENAHHSGAYEKFLPGRFFHYERLVDVIRSAMNGEGEYLEGKKFVDIGFGSGLALVLLAQQKAETAGIDSSYMARKYAEYLSRNKKFDKRPKLIHGSFYNPEDMEKLGCGHDVVFNSGVFEHESSQRAYDLMGSMVEITKPRGLVVVSIPNKGSPFYQDFKATERDIKRKYDIVETPGEHDRKEPDIERLMRDHYLELVVKDGIQIAPSRPIKPGGIRSIEDLESFEKYLPDQSTEIDVNNKIAIWRGAEAGISMEMRQHYGWSTVYIGRKVA